jgi:hypothetical protein
LASDTKRPESENDHFPPLFVGGGQMERKTQFPGPGKLSHRGFISLDLLVYLGTNEALWSI